MHRLTTTPLRREFAWYTAIGAVTTAAQAVLYLLLREIGGLALASFEALLIMTIVNTEAHRHWTFRSASHVGLCRAHVEAGATSLIVYVVNLAVTSEIDALSLGDQPVLEALVLTAVSAGSGIARFFLLRQWVFRARPGSAAAIVEPPTDHALAGQR